MFDNQHSKDKSQETIAEVAPMKESIEAVVVAEAEAEVEAGATMTINMREKPYEYLQYK